MCELMDQIAERRVAEAAAKAAAEADIRARIDMAMELIADGDYSLEKIARISKLPLEKVKELADKRTA